MAVSSGIILRSPGLASTNQFFPNLSTRKCRNRSQLRIFRVATCIACPDVSLTASVSFTVLSAPRIGSPLTRSSQKRALSGPCTTSVSLKTVDAPLEQYGNASAPPHMCLVQAFSWTSARAGPTWYEHLEEKVADLAAMGFTDVLLPPCTASADPQGFEPTDFYALTSAYGTGEQLKRLLKKMRRAGLKGSVEVVLNRISGKRLDDHVSWKASGDSVDEGLDWGDWVRSNSITPLPPNNEIGQLPAVDHSDAGSRSDAKGWLMWLRHEIGFDGFCFDFANLNDPLTVHMYAAATSPSCLIVDVWNTMRYNGSKLEYDQDQHRQELCNWVKSTRGSAMALDYTTKGILQTAVENCEYWRLIDPAGRPPGLMGWSPSKAVTFVENHVTGSTPSYWPFPNWGVMLGYCYILTHPGTPLVFWDHIYEWKHREGLEELMIARKRNGLHASSQVKILACHPDLYVARIGENVERPDFHGLLVKMGPTFDMRGHAPGAGWSLCASGHDYCVWERSDWDHFPVL